MDLPEVQDVAAVIDECLAAERSHDLVLVANEQDRVDARVLDDVVVFPVKDFLVHADKKFAGFRAADPDFRSILVIVWDDYNF